MKRILSYLTIPALFLAAASCAPKEEIEFAHEAQAFDTRSDRILVEAILPQATAADDEVYIIGAFNGGESAVGNSAYRLTRSMAIPAKWGVYVDPSAFQGGKTLADGFTFYNVQQGLERSSRNEDVLHRLTISTGEWANVYADKWAKFFEPPVEPDVPSLPEHDGVRVYIIDQTGWDAIALYQWGDVNNFGGDWPGAQVAGTWTYNGQEYKYFEYGDDIFGLGQNLIFNNNNNGTQLPDYNVRFEDGVKDYFFLVTADGVTEAPNPIEGGSTDPRAKMTETSPWGVIGSIASTGNSWAADEPMVTDGTWHACLGLALTASDEFKFRKDADWGVNFGGAFEALGEPFEVKQDGANIKVAEDGTYDLFLNPDAAIVVIVNAGDPVTLPSGEGGDTPEPPVEETKDPVTVYVQDASGWENLYLYMWGDKELCGGWPGMAVTETEKIGSVSYKKIVVDDAEGRAENLIFNNNDGTQTESFAVTLSGELFVSLDADAVITTIDPRNPDIKILVNNQTNWDAITLYAWGDAEAFGGWPGATPVGFEEVKGVKYTVFGLPADMAGKSLNLIFNNNGGGKQLADFAITVPEDELFLNINANYYVDNVEGNPRGEASTIYVVNKQGWETLNLYAWGDAEVFGGWAGAAGTKIGTWCGQPVYTYAVAADASGKTENLIFNNGEGSQFDAMTVVLGEDLYLEIENSACKTTEPATRVYVVDETGWDQISLYAWGTSEVFGGWPGASPAGTEEIGGVTYKYFEVPASAFGNTANFILNNGGNGVQLENFDCLKGQTVTRDFYFHFTADNVTVVE
ncbi:MAG: starch-binding protein [Bacteroidales bacterium]|nr:starch-binding protein [Bacteroidales bacterium]